MTSLRNLWLLLALVALPLLGHAAASDEPLDPEQAFQVKVTALDGDTLRTEWNIAQDYYLYKDKFRFTTATPGVTLGEPRLPAPQVKQDPTFGRVEVYHGRFTIDIPVKRTAAASADIALTATYQGCAEVLGLCYPPQHSTHQLRLPTPAASPAASKAASLPQALAQLDQRLGAGSSAQDEPLDPDVAFQFAAMVEGNDVVARWQIHKDYYLYRDKFSFQLKGADGVTLGSYTLPPGIEKNDPSFGRIAVYHDQVEVRIPLQLAANSAKQATLEVGYQGCAEVLGVCYPPIRKTVTLDLGGLKPAAASNSQAAPATAAPGAPLTEQDRLARFLVEKPLWLSIGLFFLLGVGLTFTPCVFPMIPILSSIIVGQGEGLTTRRAFTLSLVYVVAMALTYAVAGLVVALLGANLQAMFQNPWILGGFATIFVLLALSMFGFFELQMPASVQTRLSEISNRQGGGTAIGVGIMGILSALIVGPCVTAPLVAVLIVISQTGDPVLGFGTLFAMGMGMGVPLLVVGTSAGKLLPRAGGWMDAVKGVFGVMLLAVAIWMISRVIPDLVTQGLWALLAIVSSVYMGALEPLKEGGSGWRKLWKGLGIALLLYGAVMLIGAAAATFGPVGGRAPAPGVAATTSHLDFKRIKGGAELDRELAAAASAGRPVMLDFYADWCISCKEFENYTFSDAGVQQVLAGVTLLQADVTANDAQDQALLKRFQLIGPPSILFFGPDGQERRSYRVVGFMEANEFRSHAGRAVAR